MATARLRIFALTSAKSCQKSTHRSYEEKSLLLAGMYRLYRTGSHTFAAGGAFFIVDDSVEILHLYRPIGALLLAHLTADTAVLAGGLCVLAVSG